MSHLPKTIDKQKLAKSLDKLNKFFKNKKCRKLGEGCYRTTYDLGDGTVAKVPSKRSVSCDYNTGISANLIEYAIYKKHSKTGIFAEVKLIKKLGFPILIMEKISFSAPDIKYANKIKKNHLKFDDGYYQCGRNNKNDVVCFDYGNEFDFLEKDELKKVKVEYTKIYKKFPKKPLTKS